MAQVVVVGAGFSGLTSAAVLALAGHRVRIVATRRVDTGGPREPLVASFYPAASVLPVSVGLDRIDATVAASRTMFRALEELWPVTVRRQLHYEVFEGAAELPASFLLAADGVEEVLPSQLGGLRRRAAQELSCWSGRIGFVEVPAYLAQLVRLLEELGVEFEQRKLAEGELPAGDVVVVCAGAGSPALVGDTRPSVLLRGHLIHLDPVAVAWPSGDWTSYHYIPGAPVFAQPDGVAGELYFYPRRDCWVLGGTRQPGDLVDGNFVVAGDQGETVAIGGVSIPRPVVEVHQELLASWLGVDLFAANPRLVTGLRYARDPHGAGVRLESEGRRDQLVISNYGHGGAGVTLSWGCAARVGAALLDAGFAAEPRRDAPIRLAELVGGLVEGFRRSTCS